MGGAAGVIPHMYRCSQLKALSSASAARSSALPDQGFDRVQTRLGLLSNQALTALKRPIWRKRSAVRERPFGAPEGRTPS